MAAILEIILKNILLMEILYFDLIVIECYFPMFLMSCWI